LLADPLQKEESGKENGYGNPELDVGEDVEEAIG